jgi:hypothetical protein
MTEVPVTDSDKSNVDVCAEIMYETEEGMIHSDLCMTHDAEYKVHESYREFIHKCLDEWLDESNGTGMFWIGDPKFAAENFTES